MTSFFRVCLSIILLITFSIDIRAQEKSDSIIDGVIAVVGGNIVLKSELEGQYLQFRLGGNIKGSQEGVKCEIYENLLYQKLMFNQSQLDSATVTESQVESEMDRRMRYFISQIGSPEKLEEYYQKSLVEIKNEMRDIIKEQMLIQMTEQTVTKDVQITPSEVRSFYRNLPTDSIPEIPSEIEIGVISKKPYIGESEKSEVILRLKGFKERVAKGDAFATLAILYSEDPGSAKQGGELGMFKRGDMRQEFEAVAFKLKPSEVSDIVETEDGYHLIQAIERRGEYVNVRHILIQPKVSVANMQRAKQFLDSISNLINLKKITFEEAVQKYSDDPSKNNGGLIINPNTGTSQFENSQLDPKVFFVIDKMKAGDISSSVLYKTDRGKDEYRIYYLKERSIPHKANLDLDYAKIQTWALNNKKSEVMKTWVDAKIKKTYISIPAQYANCVFQRQWFSK